MCSVAPAAGPASGVFSCLPAALHCLVVVKLHIGFMFTLT